MTPAAHLSEEVYHTRKSIVQRRADLTTDVLVAGDRAREHVGVLLADALLAQLEPVGGLDIERLKLWMALH